MGAATLRDGRRRLRRGSVDRPLNTRLVRVSSLVLVFPLMLVAFSLARPGPLPAPQLPSAFDGDAATRLARELATTAPSRVPGSLGAIAAVSWYREHLALYGLTATADRWTQEVPRLGRVELVNLVTVVPGRSSDVIAVVAHRDNDGSTAGANDNATGTAALAELARAYGSSGGSAARVRPLHTLAFVSTDAGAFASLGAHRLANSWAREQRIVAVVTLDGLGGPGRPRIALSGLGRRSAPPILAKTIAARIGPGAIPTTTGWLSQVVALGAGFAVGEHAAFIGRGIPAVGLGNAPLAPRSRDEPAGIRARSVATIGRAAEATVLSLDEAIGLPSRASASIYVGGRAIQGWALSFLLVSLLIPFTVVVVDLLVRLAARGVTITPALRALRTRVGFWLFTAAAVFGASLAGVFPTGPPIPPAVTAPVATNWPIGGLLAIGAAVAAGWLVARTRLLPRRPAEPEQQLAGQVAALVGLGGAAVLAAAASPLALVFVAPSLVCWMWLPQLRTAPGWARDLVFGLGLSGPIVALVAIAATLDVGARATVYATALLTTGVVPWVQVASFVLWAASAAQLGAVEAGRYAPRSSA